MGRVWNKADRDDGASRGSGARQGVGAVTGQGGARLCAVWAAVGVMVCCASFAYGEEEPWASARAAAPEARRDRSPGQPSQAITAAAPDTDPEEQAGQIIHVDVNDRVTMHVDGLPLADASLQVGRPRPDHAVDHERVFPLVPQVPDVPFRLCPEHLARIGGYAGQLAGAGVDHDAVGNDHRADP